MSALAASSRSAATPNPTSGESSSDLPMLAACPQSTPDVPLLPGQELVGDAHADDGTDQRVGTGSGQAEVPCAQIPDDRGDEQGEDHGESGLAAHLQNQFDRQQRDDGKRDRPLETITPKKLQKPDHTTAMCGSKECV